MGTIFVVAGSTSSLQNMIFVKSMVEELSNRHVLLLIPKLNIRRTFICQMETMSSSPYHSPEHNFHSDHRRKTCSAPNGLGISHSSVLMGLWSGEDWGSRTVKISCKWEITSRILPAQKHIDCWQFYHRRLLELVDKENIWFRKEICFYMVSDVFKLSKVENEDWIMLKRALEIRNSKILRVILKVSWNRAIMEIQWILEFWNFEILKFCGFWALWDFWKALVSSDLADSKIP